MKHLDLFSGIGGFSLAASWVWGDEHEIASFVEIDPFCQKVLKKHWPDVPIISDIRDVTHERFFSNAIGRGCGSEGEQESMGRVEGEGQDNTVQVAESGACKRNCECPAIDLLTGGFPCQPFSVAGKRRGKKDDRYLWPEMLRVIREFRPTWIIGENVAGIINLALDQVLSDLENTGYTCQPFIIPACAVDAPHRRDRVWIVANDKGNGLESRGVAQKGQARQLNRGGEIRSEVMGNPVKPGSQRHARNGENGNEPGRKQAEPERPACAAGLREDDANPISKHDDGSGYGSSAIRRERREKTELSGCEDVADAEKLHGDVGEHNPGSCQKSKRPFSQHRNNGNAGRIKQGCGEGCQGALPGMGDKTDGLSRWMDRHLGYRWDDGSWDTIPRVSSGEKDRVNRLKALGNSIVPQCVMPIMAAIKKIEGNLSNG